jgi:L-methionine (R)-S-oxide reductase
VRVDDVSRFPGHIACDCASNAEIVVPVRAGGEVTAVLDLDSPTVGRFTAEDEAGLETFARALGEPAR